MQRLIDRERALRLQSVAGTRLAASTLYAAGWTLDEAVSLLAKRRAS